MASASNGTAVSVDLLGRLLDQVTSAVLAADERGVIVICNAEAQAVLGADAETITGRSVQELCADARIPAVRFLARILAECLQSGRSQRRQTEVVEDADGNRLLGYTVTALPSTSGGPQGVIATFVDLAAVRAREREQAEMERFAQVGRVASWMAHEIKNPLATIQMYARLCERSEGTTAKDSIQIIRDQVSLAQARVSEILRAVSLSASQPRKPAASDLKQLLRHYLVREARGLPHMELVLDVGPGTFRTPLSDSDALSLFSNLIANAAEAVEGSGHIWIRLSQTGRTITLVVEDDGPGFPDEAPHRLLQPFFTSKPRGTGLGLWVIKRVAESVGGSVLLENTEHGGARVVVDLPGLPLDILRKRQILVLDDDSARRRAVCGQLEALGARTLQAQAEDEALELIEREPVDLLVTEANILDAWDSQLKRRAGGALPTVMISGTAGTRAECACMQRPGLALLLKPFDAEDLGLALSYVQWETEHLTGRCQNE
ncbi:MAG: ATP-binding protein [Thermoleophilia bacterium]|nr:ATP-binding protein [Thermoleophilia bacterium]